MKTKLSLLFLATVISVHGAPQSVADATSEYVTEDDVSIKLITDQVKSIEKLADDNEFAVAILRSIDQKCMLNKYKTHKLLNDMLTEEAFDVTNIEEKPLDSLLVFVNIALTCSKKLNPLLGFVFDNLFSYSGLIDAFRDDEPFKSFFEEFICYNNYAVEMGLMDPAVYTSLDYKLLNETVKAECNQSINETRSGIAGTISFFSEFVLTDRRNCLESELEIAAERFFLKYVLLIPLGLTDDQKKQEKENFINDSLEGLEKLLACNIKTDEKENAKENEISTS